MQEVYAALDADLNVLAAMGMRIVFDKASGILGVDPALTFEEKLEALVDEDDRARLETLVDAGSASAHRGWRPSTEDLDTMMDVLESFVHDAFVAPLRKKRLDRRLADIRANVPPKPKRIRKRAEPVLTGGESANGNVGTAKLTGN